MTLREWNEMEHMRPAHIRISDRKVQSVKEHITGATSISIQGGKKIGMPFFISLVTKLHDMGKCTNKFENYINYSFDHPEDKSLRGQIDHSAIGAIYIFEKYGNGDSLDRITSQMMALIIASHHGGLMNCINLEGKSDFLVRLSKNKEELNYFEALENYERECFPLKDLEFEFSRAKEEIEGAILQIKKSGLFLNFSIHLLCKYLFSCLIDADRYDTMLFMENIQENSTSGSINLWEKLSENFEKNIQKKKNKSVISKLRNEISDTCRDFAFREEGIYTLNVPTGGGKTFSSLKFAIEHCRVNNKERIIYIVPYTTIIDQNAKDVRDILECGDLLLEHHSNVMRDNEDEDYKLLTQRWDSPIIFTTMIQFLNTIYSGGTQNIRRFQNLANSVLIFDEIQAVPLRCIHLLTSALNFLHYFCNSTIISCTATQPLLAKVERPLLLRENCDIIPNADEYLRKFKRVEIVDKTKIGGWTCEELALFALNQLDHLESVLIIVNTKNIAQKLFEELRKGNNSELGNSRFKLVHLSTNMCPSHRLQTIGKINSFLGKEKVICVSTQLIEAGVNISFNCVIRSLAGMESICQAAGRCNRHKEVNKRDVFVVNINEESLSRLKDIKIGQECTRRIFDEFKENPQSFENDLLSNQAIKRYYEYYYFKRKNEMDYSINGMTNIFDFLSTNKYGDSIYLNLNNEQYYFPLKQAYKDSGRLFKVINDDTISVIVPFENGEQLIQKLDDYCSFNELSKLLREVQKYSVSLYKYEMEVMIKNNAIRQLKNVGLLAISRDFYNDNFGIDINQNSRLDFLSVD